MSVLRLPMRPDAGLEPLVAVDSRWIVAGVLLCVALPLAVFAPTFAEMVGTWRRSETFAHGFFVLPAFAYLVWRQRDELGRCAVRPEPLALLGVLGSGFLVALGTLAAALTPAFFGVIGAAIFTVVAVFGRQVARAIWVPLLFLLFAVPFGEIFVPSMIDWTANFTVNALLASGVPVFRDGPNFVIPSGRWSVVDACSGIRYLLASMFAGFLYAWLVYRSTSRRLAFMAASIVVPVVANWLRAYLIVMLAHLSNNTIATGVDHFIYGWVFFGIVIALMFWVGSFFREDAEAVVPASRTTSIPLRPVITTALVAGALTAAWQFATWRLADNADPRPVVVRPVEAANGWRLADRPAGWAPQLQRPTAVLGQQFEKDGHLVSVHIGVYRNQSQDAELVNSRNELPNQIGKPWLFVSSGEQRAQFGAVVAAVNEARGRRADETLLVWQWYWIDGAVTTNDLRAKADLAFRRLFGRNDTSAWVAIFVVDEEAGAQQQTALRRFAAEMGPAIDAALRSTVDR